jgi:hypothetical protein
LIRIYLFFKKSLRRNGIKSTLEAIRRASDNRGGE